MRSTKLILAPTAATLLGMLTAPAVQAAAQTCNGLPATIVGTNNLETLTGTGTDVIVGLGGNDTISGLGSDDTIW